MNIGFRCDGDSRLGAGHVARSVQIAQAFAAGGRAVLFAGRFEGVAASLLEAADIPTTDAGDGPAGTVPGVDAWVVDSYEIDQAAVAQLASAGPTATISDGAPAVSGAVQLSYHLDADERIDAAAAPAALLGPAYAPIRPSLLSARRPRDAARALVTLGGGTPPADLAAAAVEALQGAGVREVFFAAHEVPPALEQVEGLTAGFEPGGLLGRIHWADVAISAAGSTPYDLACAGVPAVLLALADNQAPVAAAFDAHTVAVGIDARGGAAAGALEQAVGLLLGERAALTNAGVRTIDGYGAYRARDGLLATFAGGAAPRVVRYRPATVDDAELLLDWRNDPAVRAVSRTSGEIEPDEHRSWLERVLADRNRMLLIAEHDGAAVGTVRFDGADREAEISITIAPDARGSGLGEQAIRETTELYLAAHAGIERVVAEVGQRNAGSIRAFERAGYIPAGERSGEGWTTFTSMRRPGTGSRSQA